MNKPLPQPAQAIPTHTDSDLVSLSKRLTQRAAAEMTKSGPRLDVSQLSQEAEADHIAALRRYIMAKEAAIDRFREQLARFPQDIETLRQRMDKETDQGARGIILKNLQAYGEMQSTLQQRVDAFDQSWPERRAEMETAIAAYEARSRGRGPDGD